MAASKRQLVGGGTRYDVGVIDGAARAFQAAVERVARSSQQVVHLLAVGVTTAECHTTGKAAVKRGLEAVVTGLAEVEPGIAERAVLREWPHHLADGSDEIRKWQRDPGEDGLRLRDGGRGRR